MGPTSAFGTDTLRAQWNWEVYGGGGFTSLPVQGRSRGFGDRGGPGRYWSRTQIFSPAIIQVSFQAPAGRIEETLPRFPLSGPGGRGRGGGSWV